MKQTELDNWLNSISARFTGKDLRLDRIRNMLALLENPQESFKNIHVAGTSGKGSTCTFISSILSAHGYCTGLNLSPHIEKINERIQLNGVEISDSEFAKLAEKVYPAWQEVTCNADFGPPTFFEVITAMAFEHFASQKVDYAVVEVGLGGRLDATNVLMPQVSIITPISFDHEAMLGNTIQQIAGEKVGIIKQGVPVVTSASSPAFEVIKNKAVENKCDLKKLGLDFGFKVVRNSLEGLEFNYFSSSISISGIKSNLLGEHQALNASTAITACSQVVELNEEKTRAGIKTAYLPARLELVSKNPAIIIDGAHNEEKAASTANFLRNVFPNGIQLVIGMIDSRDPVPILKQLLPVASNVFFVSPLSDKTFHDAAYLANVAKQIAPNMPIEVTDLKNLKQICSKPTCITGSLYFAGIAKSKLCTNVASLFSS